MLQDTKSQGFLSSYFGYSSICWTSGFYGEAYLNFGLPGLIVVSGLVGMVIRRAELLLSSGGIAVVVAALVRWLLVGGGAACCLPQ